MALHIGKSKPELRDTLSVNTLKSSVQDLSLDIIRVLDELGDLDDFEVPDSSNDSDEETYVDDDDDDDDDYNDIEDINSPIMGNNNNNNNTNNYKYNNNNNNNNNSTDAQDSKIELNESKTDHVDSDAAKTENNINDINYSQDKPPSKLKALSDIDPTLNDDMASPRHRTVIKGNNSGSALSIGATSRSNSKQNLVSGVTNTYRLGDDIQGNNSRVNSRENSKHKRDLSGSSDSSQDFEEFKKARSMPTRSSLDPTNWTNEDGMLRDDIKAKIIDESIESGTESKPIDVAKTNKSSSSNEILNGNGYNRSRNNSSINRPTDNDDNKDNSNNNNTNNENDDNKNDKNSKLQSPKTGKSSKTGKTPKKGRNFIFRKKKAVNDNDNDNDNKEDENDNNHNNNKNNNKKKVKGTKKMKSNSIDRDSLLSTKSLSPVYAPLKDDKSNSKELNKSRTDYGGNQSVSMSMSSPGDILSSMNKEDITKIRHKSTMTQFDDQHNEYVNLPQLSGWILKLSGKGFGVWQRRWLVVKRTHMLWSSKRQDIVDPMDPKQREKWKNSITLLTIKQANKVNSKNGRKFNVITTSKTYHFRALSRNDRDRWVDGLNQHLHALAKSMTLLRQTFIFTNTLNDDDDY